MWRWTMRIFVVLGAFLIVAALSGATYQWLATRKELAATPPPGHLVDIGGYRLHLWCSGDGAPAVILDTGLGGSSADWGFVQPDVARFTRVCSYDRAGMGYSDPGPSPRTARRIASELAELLIRSGINGPAVLVGASIAGFDVRVLASDHPERVAGLVLVDASHEDQALEVPRMARFIPLLSTIGVLRLFGVSFGQRIESLAPSVRQFARATSFRAAGYQAAADEITWLSRIARGVSFGAGASRAKGSFRPQGLNRINRHCAARRQIAGQHGNCREHEGRRDERGGIERPYAEQE
jgi:pimeloyl-ACP methyl ester carboxylesterase